MTSSLMIPAESAFDKNVHTGLPPMGDTDRRNCHHNQNHNRFAVDPTERPPRVYSPTTAVGGPGGGLIGRPGLLVARIILVDYSSKINTLFR